MNSSFKYMYFLSVGPSQVISLYFYCLHLATGESWLSGLIFPDLLSSLLDLPVWVYWVFPTELYYEIQVVFWKYVASDELQEKHRWISDSNMPELLPAHLMGFQRLQSNCVVQSLSFWQTLSCRFLGLDFLSLQSPCHTHKNHRSFGSAFQVRFFGVQYFLAWAGDPRSPRSPTSASELLCHANLAVNNQDLSCRVAHRPFDIVTTSGKRWNWE